MKELVTGQLYTLERSALERQTVVLHVKGAFGGLAIIHASRSAFADNLCKPNLRVEDCDGAHCVIDICINLKRA